MDNKDLASMEDFEDLEDLEKAIEPDEQDLDESTSITIPFIISLSKPLSVNGTEYTELDLSGLEDLTIDEYSEMLKQYEKLNGAGSGAMPEYEMDFALMVVEKVLHIPRSILQKVKAKDGAKIRHVVTRFFLQ